MGRKLPLLILGALLPGLGAGRFYLGHRERGLMQVFATFAGLGATAVGGGGWWPLLAAALGWSFTDTAYLLATEPRDSKGLVVRRWL